MNFEKFLEGIFVTVSDKKSLKTFQCNSLEEFPVNFLQDFLNKSSCLGESVEGFLKNS